MSTKISSNLKEIATDLRNIDFTKFDPTKDKQKMLEKIRKINAKLGKILREFENETN